jgi:hypothetical protein
MRADKLRTDLKRTLMHCTRYVRYDENKCIACLTQNLIPLNWTIFLRRLRMKRRWFCSIVSPLLRKTAYHVEKVESNGKAILYQDFRFNGSWLD